MAELQLFNVLPDQFFSVLSSKHKQIYIDCIYLMYQYMSGQLSFSSKRDELIPILTEFFDSIEEAFFDEKGEQITEARDRASAVLRRLDQCGWISQTTNNNYETIISFHDYSINIIQTLISLTKTNQLELQGVVYNIYSAIKQYDDSSITFALDQVYSGTEKLVTELKKLSSNLNKYIQRVIDEAGEDNAEELMSMLIIDYSGNDTYAAYNRLKTSDNVSKFRPFIIEELEVIRENTALLEIVSEELVKIKQHESTELGKQETIHKINQVIDTFKDLDDYLDEIDRKHTRYLSTTISKIQFSMNNRVDLSGKINAILKHLVSTIKTQELNPTHDELTLTNELFIIDTQAMLDEQSLYTVRKRREAFKAQTIEMKEPLDEATKEQRIQQLMHRQRYTKAKINEHVKLLLGNKEVINASSIPIQTQEDFLLLIYIFTYSNSRNMCYTIKRSHNRVQVKQYVFNDFEIWRKK